jgi:hypothetical protein
MGTDIDYELNSERSTFTPEIDSGSIKLKKDVMINVNHRSMSRICRSCGSILHTVRFCNCCSEAVKWDCDRCWSICDVTHSHIGNFNFSEEGAINESSV